MVSLSVNENVVLRQLCTYYYKLLFSGRTAMNVKQLYQIRRPLGLVFVIYFWWLGELLLLYI
jgi:hypothetical protein